MALLPNNEALVALTWNWCKQKIQSGLKEIEMTQELSSSRASEEVVVLEPEVIDGPDSDFRGRNFRQSGAFIKPKVFKISGPAMFLLLPFVIAFGLICIALFLFLSVALTLFPNFRRKLLSKMFAQTMAKMSTQWRRNDSMP